MAVAALLVMVGAWLWWPGRGSGTQVGKGRSVPPTVAASSPVIEPQAAAFARYAGSAACRDCHAGQHSAWHASNHGMAERELDDSLDRHAFDPPRSFVHGSQSTDVSWNAGKAAVETPGLEGKRESMPVMRVIGHDPLRQFLVTFPGGRLQTLEASWDPRTNEWFNVYGSEDRRPGEWGHWSGRGMNWNAMCGTCHNTRYRKNYDPGMDTYQTSMAERTVGCEACHGPMKDHTVWQRAWKDSGKKDPTLIRRTPAQHMEACAPCHARRGELTGDFVPGDSFWDHYLLAIVDDTEVFYPDGQVREEDYEYAAFMGSRMHAAGVTCLDCHDPHLAEPKLRGNDLCIRCHNGTRPGAPIIDPVRHSFHTPGGPGSACVDCHMPQTAFMQRHWRHDHGFTTPDPVMTREFGIPNACNRCHTDRDANWAAAACETWYGKRMERPARERTRLLARARRGDVAVREGVSGLLGSKESPYWRASAIALLAQWAGEPAVRDRLVGALDDAHPLVRHRAVQALSPWVEGRDTRMTAILRGKLEDASRGVRVAAGWALRGQGDLGAPVDQELAHMLRENSDQPTGQAQLAVAAMSRGRMSEALEHYGKAVAWDGGSPGLRHDFAVALSQAGRPREALEQTREAVRIQPGVAENHYRLGLAWAEVGDLGQAVVSLEEAVRLEPGHDRAAYNLGLAYQQRGDSARSLTLLERAERANPRDARIPYARATVLMGLDRRTEAGDAARRALEIEPGHAGARELLRDLGR